MSISSVTTRPSRAFMTGVLLALAGMAVVALHSLQPHPYREPESERGFSAARAMTFVRKIAVSPHPIGTVDQTRVRNYLLDVLRSMKFEPKIQSGLSALTERRRAVVGEVKNILLRLPGQMSGGRAVLLVAHYDSVTTGQGAADDAASVGAILETLRALKQENRLRNDLIVLLTDGEEAGLLGAELFVSEHPWAKDVALALNFEYRGTSGAMTLFETGPKNGELVELWASATPHPVGNSMFGEIYRFLPSDTDMSAFKRAKIPWLNFAAAEDYANYHTSLDNPDHLDQATLQHEGETMLALVKAVGNAPIDTLTAQDYVFFNLPVLGVIRYSEAYVVPLTTLTAIITLVALVVGIRKGRLRPISVLISGLLFALSMVVLAILSQGLWMVVQFVVPGYSAMITGTVYNSQWYLVAILALILGVFVFLQLMAQRWLREEELSTGVLLCCAALLITATAVAPAATFVFAWPLLAMASAAAYRHSRSFPGMSTTESLVLAIGLIPGVLLLVPLVYSMYVALTPSLILPTAATIVLLFGLALPLLSAAFTSWRMPFASLMIGAALLAIGVATSGFDSMHPRPDNLFFVQYDANDDSLWLSTDTRRDLWTGKYLATAERRRVPEVFGTSTEQFLAAVAPNLSLPAPRITAVGDLVATTGARSLDLHIDSQRNAPELRVFVEGAPVLESKVNGKLFSSEPRDHWMLQAYAIDENGLDIDLQLPEGIPVHVKAVDVTYGLPEVEGPGRPPDTIAQPSPANDTTRVIAIAAF